MREVRPGAAIAVSLSLMLLIAACSSEPPPMMVPPPPPLPVPPPRVVVIEPPDRVHAELVRWFSVAGYRPFQVEALADHARLESGFRPCAAGAADLRYTFQWGGTRLRRLHQFAGAPRCPPLDIQLAFADNELRNEPRFWCFWEATTRATALAALRRGFGGGSC